MLRNQLHSSEINTEAFMLTSLTLLCTLFLADSPVVQSKCVQAVPPSANGKWKRTPERTQAVLLIHGYQFQLSDETVPTPQFRPWQRAEGALVKELGRSVDVFLFAYGQNADIDGIVKESKLRDNIEQIRKLGYSEIILVGHSAGGLIARHLIEDHPDINVARVVQVCCPNTGSPYAKVKGLKSQQAFIDCLSEEGRAQCLKGRSTKQIPARIQFLCVVARGDGVSGTDGVVPCISQWPEDLRKQGIPAVGLLGGHRDMMNEAKLAVSLGRLICAPQPRWNAERIEQARKEILGK